MPEGGAETLDSLGARFRRK
ncbi:hypothetical protein DSL72_008949 [Monilinia vaccinii-corymbosi]|uniref:Uncharacterized protein n=1 Tax=Monilinia vaccinii-corymbosi TaxID=61207 RepID=A0A8A3PSK5_9HELO|nr:hypothetical protein DSL72_008949 [Monilinia vaccinii-corymbosi]